MAICTLCLIGAVIFGCSTGQVVYRSKGFKDNFMFEFDEICKEMDCNNAQYNYHRNSCQGPHHWSQVTPCWSKCSSFHQSPVNILTNSALYRPLGNLQFSNVCERVGINLTHKGHTPHFYVRENSSVILRNVPHKSEHCYVFRDIHVHLGRTEGRGSEHAFDGAFSPMEVTVLYHIQRTYRSHFTTCPK
uniref:carbonic anhydrase n=1 Tax=Crassostrea virginica TaxID=6565 RepID=A0A8B8AXF5_CRAVI|nr:nacrein-like protein [Crassostrea virginica]